MKTLVTGASGFIGSTIVRKLLEKGADVRVVIRKGSDTKNIDTLDVETVYGDIRDSDSIRGALKGCDTLYHVAAYFAHWSPNKKLFYDINVNGTKNILGEALAQGVDKVVYTSTSNTIGSHGAGNFVTEEAQFNGWKTGDHYAISKYLAEIEAKKIYDKEIGKEASISDGLKYEIEKNAFHVSIFLRPKFDVRHPSLKVEKL